MVYWNIYFVQQVIKMTLKILQKKRGTTKKNERFFLCRRLSLLKKYGSFTNYRTLYLNVQMRDMCRYKDHIFLQYAFVLFFLFLVFLPFFFVCLFCFCFVLYSSVSLKFVFVCFFVGSVGGRGGAGRGGQAVWRLGGLVRWWVELAVSFEGFVFLPWLAAVCGLCAGMLWTRRRFERRFCFAPHFSTTRALLASVCHARPAAKTQFARSGRDEWVVVLCLLWVKNVVSPAFVCVVCVLVCTHCSGKVNADSCALWIAVPSALFKQKVVCF